MEAKTWKDTVDKAGMLVPLNVLHNLRKKMLMGEIEALLLKERQAQAEISFKAGMTKVVSWIEANRFGLKAMDNYLDLGIDLHKWQAFLKENGIKEA